MPQEKISNGRLGSSEASESSDKEKYQAATQSMVLHLLTLGTAALNA